MNQAHLMLKSPASLYYRNGPQKPPTLLGAKGLCTNFAAHDRQV